jgi:uncharacterized membrane protein
MKELNIKQKISVLALIISISGIIGWIYEVFFYYLNSGLKEVYMRGPNFLPWINIYAWGSLLIILTTYKFKDKPLLVFLISLISTGLLEFFSGYILYGVLGLTRQWDYNVEILNFGNINGYVCLRSVLVFGLSGLLLMYVIVPLLIKLVKSKYKNVIFVISIVLFTLFTGDEVYNLIIAKLFNLPNAIDVYKSLGFNYM